MSEFPGAETETAPLSPELAAILPEVARIKLAAELRGGGVCSGFGSTNADYQFYDDTERLWQTTTGITDPAQFESTFQALSNAIEAQGGAEAVRQTYLNERQQR